MSTLVEKKIVIGEGRTSRQGEEGSSSKRDQRGGKSKSAKKRARRKLAGAPADELEKNSNSQEVVVSEKTAFDIESLSRQPDFQIWIREIQSKWSDDFKVRVASEEERLARARELEVKSSPVISSFSSNSSVPVPAPDVCHQSYDDRRGLTEDSVPGSKNLSDFSVAEAAAVAEAAIPPSSKVIPPPRSEQCARHAGGKGEPPHRKEVQNDSDSDDSSEGEEGYASPTEHAQDRHLGVMYSGRFVGDLPTMSDEEFEMELVVKEEKPPDTPEPPFVATRSSRMNHEAHRVNLGMQPRELDDDGYPVYDPEAECEREDSSSEEEPGDTEEAHLDALCCMFDEVCRQEVGDLLSDEEGYLSACSAGGGQCSSGGHCPDSQHSSDWDYSDNDADSEGQY
jgi:hypothetical protein